MPETFNPFKWYWLSDNGRIYDSEQQRKATSSDQRYLDWLAIGNFPTRWPQDDSGSQTDAALQLVLNDYGLWVNGPPPPPPIQIPVDTFFERTTEDEAEEIEAAMLAKPVKIKRAYQAATVFKEGTDLWGDPNNGLWVTLQSLFGEERRNDLMARPSVSESRAEVTP